MTNLFDKTLPKTTTYWTEGNIFFIKTTHFFVSEDEGKAMADLLIYAMEESTTTGIVLDNREAKGAWPKNIHQIWESDQRYTKLIDQKKIATLTNSALTTNQINRLSREHGIENTSKTFNKAFDQEVKAFFG